MAAEIFVQIDRFGDPKFPEMFEFHQPPNKINFDFLFFNFTIQNCGPRFRNFRFINSMSVLHPFKTSHTHVTHI